MGDGNHVNEESPLLTKASTTETADFLFGDHQDRINDSLPAPDDQQENNDDHGLLETIAEDAAVFMEDAAIFMEEVVEEMHGVTDNIMEEFQEVDDTDMHFLEMSLLRNLSVLPGDIVVTADVNVPSTLPVPIPPDLEVAGAESQENGVVKETPSQEGIPLSAYSLLLSAVVALSSVGPLLQLQQDVPPTLKIFWRMQGTAILLLPFTFREVYRKGTPLLTWAQWVTFLMSTASYAVLTVAFVQALNYTAVGNAVILANSLALILLAGKLFVGDPVTFMEGAGAVVAFCGAALCSKDSAENTSAIPGSSLFGDALAILSAIGGVGYLIFAKTSRPHFGSVFVFMFLTMSVGCIMVLLFAIFILEEPVTFDRHPNHGVWGFFVMEQDRFPLEVTMVVVCNFFGTMGYVRAMQYFDNLVISSAALLEPVIAEFVAFSLGVGSLPGWQGWLGNVLVAGGTFAVVYKDSTQGDGKGTH